MTDTAIRPVDHPAVQFGKVGILLVNLGTPDGTDYTSMRRYLRDTGRVWEEVRPEPRIFDTAGQVVVVTGRIYAWGVGRVVDQPVGWTFRVRDGRVAYAEVHETAEAAQVAGQRLGRLV